MTGIQTTQGRITADYLHAKNDANGNPRRGWSIYIDSRDIGFVPERFSGAQALRDALEHFEVPGAQDMRVNVRELVEEADKEISGTDYNTLCNTWEWDDRLMRGELEQYRGIAK